MDEKLNVRVVATIEKMAIAIIPSSNALHVSVSRQRAGNPPEAAKDRNLHTAFRRFQKKVDKAQNK